MSFLHPRSSSATDTSRLERVLRDQTVRRLTYRHSTVDRDHDIPHLTGYSQNGETIYIDRDLPQRLKIEEDGRSREVDITHHLVEMMALEKALLDGPQWNFGSAHECALAACRRQVLAAGLPWRNYCSALGVFGKAAELARLSKVPADLDLTGYAEPEVDRRLLTRLTEVQEGGTKKSTKQEAHYRDDRGVAARHCGPARRWPGGNCGHFKPPAACHRVYGVIRPQGSCDYWESEAEQAEEDVK
jgi:hypothetical protein